MLHHRLGAIAVAAVQGCVRRRAVNHVERGRPVDLELDRRLGRDAAARTTRAELGLQTVAETPTPYLLDFGQSIVRFRPPEGTEYIGHPTRSEMNSRTVEFP